MILNLAKRKPTLFENERGEEFFENISQKFLKKQKH